MKLVLLGILFLGVSCKTMTPRERKQFGFAIQAANCGFQGGEWNNRTNTCRKPLKIRCRHGYNETVCTQQF